MDRIDILYGLGVRQLGVTYSESNALGSGCKEDHDGGLTMFGKSNVERRLKKVGMLIDVSHWVLRPLMTRWSIPPSPLL